MSRNARPALRQSAAVWNKNYDTLLRSVIRLVSEKPHLPTKYYQRSW